MDPFPPWALVLTITLMRELLIIGLLLGLCPLLLMPQFPGRGSIGMVGRGAIFTFSAITLAHFLAMTRLYEGLVVLVLVSWALAWRQFYARPPAEREGLVRRYSLSAYEWLDWVTRRRRRRPEPLWEFEVKTIDWRAWLRLHGPTWALAVLVLGASAWMRFAMAFAHAAPAFSDAPVTLAWMKLFGRGELYPDGVYPMGMYAILSVLKKLTFQNDFLVMSAFGPLVGFGLVLTVFLFLRWVTGSIRAGVIGALVYGTLPALIPSDVARQAGYNSQEFGMLFILPATWFAYQYLVHGRPWEGIAAAAAAGTTMIVHPISGLMGVVFVGGAASAAFLHRAPWRRLLRLVALSAGASLVAVLPPVIGLVVLGKSWHGSSLAFLSEKSSFDLFVPPWPMGAVGILALFAPWLAEQSHRRTIWMAFTVVVTGLLLWILPSLFPLGPLATLALRLVESGGFALAIAAGLAWTAFERGIASLGSRRWLPSVVALGVIIGAWWAYPPRPLQPPRISTDRVIEQVLRMDRDLTQGTWLLVMEEPGYALALGRGAHQYPEWFVANAWVGLTGWCFDEGGRRLRGPQHVVLIAEQGKPSTPSLLKWIDRYRDRLPLTRISAAVDLEVWWLRYERDTKSEFEQVWGETDLGCKVDLLPPA